jgi:hypothetical protein
MTDFLNALKTDLSDRRLVPIVALVVVALLAAIAYVAVGGGSSTSTPTAAVTPSTVTPAGSHLSVSQTSTEKPVAETTEGTGGQHRGAARDPFVALPSVAVKTTTTPAAATTPTGSSSPTTTTPAKETTPSKPSKPAKPKIVYHVAVLAGVVPAGAPQPAVLPAYENLKLLTPLPSATEPLLVFRGVTTGGHSATFTVVGETILHGTGSCLPNASQCQAIDLGPGQSEQLEYLPADGGPTVTYELRVVTIASSKASTASAKSMFSGISKAGRDVLRRAGLVAIPYLHYSSRLGVWAFSSRPAFAARAHAARRFDSSR